MLELRELKFRNIGRFTEEQSIDFTSFSPFAQVDGKNNNTGGSSGSGKSTVFMALEYLLGVNKRPATILQSRYTEEPLWVQGIFSSRNGETATVTRSKSLIQFEKGEEKAKGIKAEELVDEMLGMPRDLFRKVIHKRQKEGGFFLSFTPQQMHDFLIDCIGLSTFKQKYKTTEDRLKFVCDKLGSMESGLANGQSALSATQDAILSLGLAPVQDMHKEVILELKEKYDRSAVRFADVEKNCESSYREFSKNRPNITNREYDGTAREALEKRTKEIEAAIDACFDKEFARQNGIESRINAKTLECSKIVARIKSSERAKADAAALASEIKSIQSQLCPTCSQGWATEEATKALDQKLYTLKSLKALIVDGVKAEEENAALADLLADLKTQLTPQNDPALPDLNGELATVTGAILKEKQKAGELYEQQNAETRKLLDVFVTAQGELTMKHKKEIDQARGQMDLDRRVLDVAVQKLKSYDEAKNRFDKTHSELKAKEADLNERFTKLRNEMEELDSEQKKAEETLKALKTYVSFRFDEALDDISEKATKIIRCIPNMSNATIQFEGTKENKDGKVKEEVNAVISVDGEPGVPIKSLSGGEESALDLAVDLAVIDYIETRSGMGMNLFILDEPFNGLGTVEIEMALDVLKNSNTNKKLIIVDHNPEVKQMVQSRLVVERTGLTSKVV